MAAKYLVGFGFWLGLLGVAQGAIVAWTPWSTGYATHNSGTYSATQSATLLDWNEPYTTSMLSNNDPNFLWETRGRFRTTLPIATTNQVRMEGSYFGFAGVTAQQNPAGFMFSAVEGTGDLTFQLDSPGVVTISAFDTALNTQAQFNGTMDYTGRLRFNGTDYVTNAANASFTFNVGPGIYNAQFFASTSSLILPLPSGQVMGDMSANYRIDVLAVPEPSSLILILPSLIGLVCVTLRRRNRRV